MKKIIKICLLCLCGNSSLLLAQSDFQSIIESEIVKDKITLQLVGNNLNISIDNGEAKELVKELSLQGRSEQLIVNSRFIHPLKHQISLENKIVDDELTKAAQEYFSQFQSYVVSISNSSSGNEAASGMAVTSSSMDVTIKSPHLIELFSLLNGSYENFFNANAVPSRNPLLNAMAKVDDKNIELQIIKKYETIFDNIMDIANYEQIKKTIEHNKTILKEIDELLTNVSKNHTKLKLEAQSFANVFITTDATAVDKNTVSLISNKIEEVVNDHALFLKRKSDLDVKYAAFVALLEKILLNTYGDKIKETRIEDLTFEKGKRNVVTVYLKNFDYNKETKSITEKEQKSYTIYLRKYQTFIPVVASGVLYTNLSFESYGTETNEADETVVSQGESKDNEIAIGAYLNMYYNNGWENPLFFQIGVGPSKEKPLLFTGLGINIGSRISISGGAVFTWAPTLDELSVGDIITGTTQIEDDLVYKFTNSPKFYLGLNFDLTK